MDRNTLEGLHRAHVSRLAADTGQALRKHGYDALVVHSGAPQKRTQADDQYWPLRVTPEFQHWLPLMEPGCALVVEPGRKPRLLRLRETNFWEALALPETDHFWGSFDVVEASSAPAMRDLLPRARVANPPQLVAALDQLRVHKTPYEEECIAEANRRAAAGHEDLRRLFADGDRPELELHLAFLGATKQDDADTPYKNIVALGAHSATLHHVSYSKRAQPAQSLLVDAGACFAGYCSDVTRTWVKGGGGAGSAFAGLVAQVDAMQQRLCAQARTGLPYEALHDESHRQVGGILRETGLLKTSGEEGVAAGVTRAFYPHGPSCATRPSFRSDSASPSSRASTSSMRCSARFAKGPSRAPSTGGSSMPSRPSAASASKTTWSSAKTASATSPANPSPKAVALWTKRSPRSRGGRGVDFSKKKSPRAPRLRGDLFGQCTPAISFLMGRVSAASSTAEPMAKAATERKSPGRDPFGSK